VVEQHAEIKRYRDPEEPGFALRLKEPGLGFQEARWKADLALSVLVSTFLIRQRRASKVSRKTNSLVPQAALSLDQVYVVLFARVPALLGEPADAVGVSPGPRLSERGLTALSAVIQKG
jgi:hypothetical protein